MTVIYPQMEEEINKMQYLNALFSHLDVCKDVCDHFGITTTIVPYRQKQSANKIVGFTSKSFKSKNALTEGEKTGEYDFGYDPFWDDGTDFDSLYKGIDDEYDNEEGEEGIKRKKNSAANIVIENKIPSDDDEIIDITKTWVDKVRVSACTPCTSAACAALCP